MNVPMCHSARCSLFDPDDRRAGDDRFVPQARSAACSSAIPVMFVVYVGSILTTRLCRAGARRQGRSADRVHPRLSRSGCGSRCCSRTSPKRWPKAAARRRRTALRRRAARTSRRRSSPSRRPRRRSSAVSRRRPAAQGRPRARRGRRDSFPATARSIEGVGVGRRERDHRRDRAGDPRERRRSQRRSPAARACCPTGSSCASRRNPGETFLDRMIAMVEGAKRQKTPNEIALDILLAALTLVFLLATVDAAAVLALQRRSGRQARHARSRSPCWSRCSSA